MLGAEVKRRRFDVEEYHWMGRVGILSADDRVELVRGEVVEMTPIGSLHQSCVNVLNYLFMRSLGDRYIVSVQGPVHLGEFSEPQPDVAVLKGRSDFYRASHPTPGYTQSKTCRIGDVARSETLPDLTLNVGEVFG